MDLFAFTDGVNMTPLPFTATITVRSKEKADLIDHHFRDQSSLFTAYEQDLSAEDKEFVKATRRSAPFDFNAKSMT